MSQPGPFFGRTYRYPTPSHGEQTIGVGEILTGLWEVCWIVPNGPRMRLKSRQLPAMVKPETLQSYLDQWAQLHKLEEVV